MLAKIIEKQLGALLDKDSRELNKLLKLIVLGIYALTAVQLRGYISSMEILFFPGADLTSNSGKVVLELTTTIFAISGYFLLTEVSISFQRYADAFISDALRLIKGFLSIKSESVVYKNYRHDPGFLIKYNVEMYLETHQDDRIQKKYDNHNRFVNSLMERKRDAMAIALLLAINYYINYEKFNLISTYTRPYWLVVIGLAVWSAIVSYEDVAFMYIPDNKIRNIKDE